MEIILFFLKDVFLPIIITVITLLLGILIDYKKNKPVILVSHDEHGKNLKIDLNSKISYLDGFFYDKRKYNEELVNFLKKKKYYIFFNLPNLLDDLVIYFRNKDFKINSLNFYSADKYLIKDILVKFKNDEDFLEILKKYETYKDNSKWLIKFTNIGKSEAYDFKIVELVENKGNSVIYTKTLNKGDSYNLILYYFDKSIRVNTFNYSYKSKFEFGYSKTEKIEFYLVNKKRYNKKDEKLFIVEYKDSNARKKEYYFCAKNIKQKELNKKNYK